ncbi:hypothetical protein AiwAL_16835 [Acidiphilium sp. AL]|uniref:hypothetical protein n=1 Tax=Acidiphilium sp. AL TaxID=2871704 RepID=UPI0021CB4F2F|nr:hypothetical protein [Acidiphilium sp. AL]MCU4161746.1 hypothetical protein [Acidiphilium sp. AL]
MTPIERRLTALEGRAVASAPATKIIVIARPGEALDDAMTRCPTARIVLPDNGRDDG